MAALDTVTSTGTAIGATLAATTIAAGDSFQIKNGAPNSDIFLLNFWVDNQVAGEARIRSPKMHDNVDAIRSRAQNAVVDLLRANTDFAVFGMTTNTECAAICLRGPDTANLRVSVPGEPDFTEDGAWWFRLLSMHYGLPCIPVINSANKGGTLIDCVNDENAGTANI